MVLQLTNEYFASSLYSLLFSELKKKGVSSRIYIASDNLSKPFNNKNIFLAPKCNFIQRLLFFPKQRVLYRDVINKGLCNDITLVHAHKLFTNGYLAYRLYKKYGIPYIVAIRNTDVNIIFKYLPHLRPLGRLIAKHAKRIIYISHAYQKQCIGPYLPHNTLSKSVVIPNGIDSIFLNNCSTHAKDENCIRLLFVGRINKNKNIETLIDVSNMLIQSGYNVSLTLVGDIEEKHYLHIIHSYTYINWFPHCSKEKVIDYLRNNDIFVMVSHTETFGLVYAEALSQGLPIIYTRGQGFDGYFNDGEVGYSVPSQDAKYIANKIIEIYNRYDDLSNNCIKCAQQFNWQNIANEYIKIYQTS